MPGRMVAQTWKDPPPKRDKAIDLEVLSVSSSSPPSRNLRARASNAKGASVPSQPKTRKRQVEVEVVMDVPAKKKRKGAVHFASDDDTPLVTKEPRPKPRPVVKRVYSESEGSEDEGPVMKEPRPKPRPVAKRAHSESEGSEDEGSSKKRRHEDPSRNSSVQEVNPPPLAGSTQAKNPMPAPTLTPPPLPNSNQAESPETTKTSPPPMPPVDSSASTPPPRMIVTPIPTHPPPIPPRIDVETNPGPARPLPIPPPRIDAGTSLGPAPPIPPRIDAFGPARPSPIPPPQTYPTSSGSDGLGDGGLSREGEFGRDGRHGLGPQYPYAYPPPGYPYAYPGDPRSYRPDPRLFDSYARMGPYGWNGTAHQGARHGYDQYGSYPPPHHQPSSSMQGDGAVLYPPLRDATPREGYRSVTPSFPPGPQ